MNTSQEHLPVERIQDDLVWLKTGDVALVMRTSAVNFGLLSEEEQIAIIGSFAGLLNSLSFPIQILIRSKRLDISAYLKRLEQAQMQQANPLLSHMIQKYKAFVEQIIRENEVLDKQFFMIIPMWSYEVGLLGSGDQTQKALTVLSPRRDALLRQLASVGLQAKPLTTPELIKLFYDVYNPPLETTPLAQPLSQPAPVTQAPQSVIATAPAPALFPTPQPALQNPPPAFNLQPARPMSSHTPFVVEELPDDYGVI